MKGASATPAARAPAASVAHVAAAPASAQAPTLSTPWCSIIFIVLGGLVAYANSFTAPFIFDDLPALVENPALREPWHLGEAMFPDAAAGGVSLSGRPVLALTFALNRAVGGFSVGGYHAVNLLIHLAAGLTLLGLLRRTLRRVPVLAASADLTALTIAFLWTVHPLQTESITYIVQRAEALAGLFYLLTLYTFARAAETDLSPSRSRWSIACIAACALGMATKETVVTAPLMIWFYDRTFFAGSFAAAWRRRKGAYLGLAATWLLLIALVLSTGGNRGGTVGLGVGVTPWAYALTQFEAVARYLWLAVCPYPLVFEYGTFWAEGAAEVLPFAVPVLAVLAGTIWALARRPVLGFAGAWFFGILAPTSLTPGTIQMIVEHRVYLSLAAVLAVVVVVAQTWLGRRAAWLLGAAALAFVALTCARNALYRDEIRLWRDTVEKRPRNAIALTNLGRVLYRSGAIAEAVLHYEQALQVNPRHLEARFNLALALVKLGRPAEAIPHYEEAARLAPVRSEILLGFAQALAVAGRLPEAAQRAAEALRLAPQSPDAHRNLGAVLLQQDKLAEAAAEFDTALRLRPDDPETFYQLGNVRAQEGKMPEAAAYFEKAIKARPSYVDAHVNLGNALLSLERIPAAAASYEAALRLDPRHADAHFNLGIIFLNTDRPAQAIPHFAAALATRPDFPAAQQALAEARARSGRL